MYKVRVSLGKLSKTTKRILPLSAKLFWAQWLSVKGGGVPPKSAKENYAKKQVFLGKKNSICCLLHAFLAPFGQIYGLFGPFLTLFTPPFR